MCFWEMPLSEGGIENRDRKKMTRVFLHDSESIQDDSLWSSLVCHPTSKPLWIEVHENCLPDAIFSPQRRSPVLLEVVS